MFAARLPARLPANDYDSYFLIFSIYPRIIVLNVRNIALVVDQRNMIKEN